MNGVDLYIESNAVTLTGRMKLIKMYFTEVQLVARQQHFMHSSHLKCHYIIPAALHSAEVTDMSLSNADYDFVGYFVGSKGGSGGSHRSRGRRFFWHPTDQSG